MASRKIRMSRERPWHFLSFLPSHTAPVATKTDRKGCKLSENWQAYACPFFKLYAHEEERNLHLRISIQI